MSKISDAVGKKFNNLTIHGRTENSYDKINVSCDCNPNVIYSINAYTVIDGRTKSCGCLKSLNTTMENKLRATHGYANTKIYYIWRQMIQRCHNELHKDYKNYGAKGITVCKEWHDVSNFATWLIQMVM
jgi:hypothetical protein